jgi:hypothetical protein
MQMVCGPRYESGTLEYEAGLATTTQRCSRRETARKNDVGKERLIHSTVHGNSEDGKPQDLNTTGMIYDLYSAVPWYFINSSHLTTRSSYFHSCFTHFPPSPVIVFMCVCVSWYIIQMDVKGMSACLYNPTPICILFLEQPRH